MHPFRKAAVILFILFFILVLNLYMKSYQFHAPTRSDDLCLHFCLYIDVQKTNRDPLDNPHSSTYFISGSRILDSTIRIFCRMSDIRKVNIIVGYPQTGRIARIGFSEKPILRQNQFSVYLLCAQVLNVCLFPIYLKYLVVTL